MSHAALLRAIARYDGNATAFARAIQRKQQTVSYWVRNGKSVPAELVLTVEGLTGIPRHELRPDIYPPPLKSVPAEEQQEAA